MLKPCVYILKCRNNRYYIGSTVDLERRFSEHCRGHVKATRNLCPLEIAYYQVYDSIEKARQIELGLKKLKRRDIIERIIKEKRIDFTRP